MWNCFFIDHLFGNQHQMMNPGLATPTTSHFGCDKTTTGINCINCYNQTSLEIFKCYIFEHLISIHICDSVSSFKLSIWRCKLIWIKSFTIEAWIANLFLFIFWIDCGRVCKLYCFLTNYRLVTLAANFRLQIEYIQIDLLHAKFSRICVMRWY